MKEKSQVKMAHTEEIVGNSFFRLFTVIVCRSVRKHKIEWMWIYIFLASLWAYSCGKEKWIRVEEKRFFTNESFRWLQRRRKLKKKVNVYNIMHIREIMVNCSKVWKRSSYNCELLTRTAIKKLCNCTFLLLIGTKF